MNNFSVCLYGNQDVGFTYLLDRNGELVATSGPGSDYGVKGDGRGETCATMTEALWHAMRSVRGDGARIAVHDPEGRLVFLGFAEHARGKNFGDLLAMRVKEVQR